MFMWKYSKQTDKSAKIITISGYLYCGISLSIYTMAVYGNFEVCNDRDYYSTYYMLFKCTVCYACFLLD